MSSYIIIRIVKGLTALYTVARGAERGQGLVEYAAILGFVAACLVVAVLFLEPTIATELNTVANSFH